MVSVTAMRASAAQRESRLTRPHCEHNAMANNNLNRIVHHATALTESKHDAFHLVVTICRSAAE